MRSHKWVSVSVGVGKVEVDVCDMAELSPLQLDNEKSLLFPSLTLTAASGSLLLKAGSHYTPTWPHTCLPVSLHSSAAPTHSHPLWVGVGLASIRHAEGSALQTSPALTHSLTRGPDVILM